MPRTTKHQQLYLVCGVAVLIEHKDAVEELQDGVELVLVRTSHGRLVTEVATWLAGLIRTVVAVPLAAEVLRLVALKRRRRARQHRHHKHTALALRRLRDKTLPELLIRLNLALLHKDEVHLQHRRLLGGKLQGTSDLNHTLVVVMLAARRVFEQEVHNLRVLLDLYCEETVSTHIMQGKAYLVLWDRVPVAFVNVFNTSVFVAQC